MRKMEKYQAHLLQVMSQILQPDPVPQVQVVLTFLPISKT